MKKKISFKIVALAMSMILVIVPMLTVLSNAKGEESCPIIFIHGLMATDIYVDPDDPEQGTVWPPSSEMVMDTVKSAVPALLKFAATRDWDTFGDEACAAVRILVDQLECDENGVPKGKTGALFNYPDASSVNKDSIVSFKYDWRIDPRVVAQQLNDFIDYVIECSGSDKVNISCHSLGGVVTQTYLKMFGDSKVKGVCFNTTAIYGQTYIGELMTGQIAIDADALEYFLRYALDYNEYKTLINDVIALLNDAGVLDLVASLGNELINHLLEKVTLEVLAPLYGNWLSIWSMTRDEDVESAEDFFFNTVYANEDRSVLKSKIDSYGEEIRAYKTQTLEELNSKANLYVISRYGYCSIPLTPSFECASDGVVDAKSTSFGATFAPYGQTLSDEEIAGTDAKYISPDRTVNASTCLFPEQTWFIKNMQHGNNPNSIDEMIYTLLRHDGQATVDTFERYPRFNKYDPAVDVISPDTDSGKVTFFEHIKLVIEEIVKLFTKVFDMIIGK